MTINLPGLAPMSIREALLFRQSLSEKISAALLPTQSFRWEEPTQNYKASAVLFCEDPLYMRVFQPMALPDELNVPQSVQSVAVGYVIQQRQSGLLIPEGQYIAVAAPDYQPFGYADFEDAQAAVCGKIRAMGVA
jgi:hypothetical protein